MSRVTEQDRAFAERLVTAVWGDSRLPKERLGEVASVLADYRDAVLACAVVRVGRVYAIRERKVQK